MKIAGKTLLWLKKKKINQKKHKEINLQKMYATTVDKLAVGKMIIVLLKIEDCNICCSFKP